MTEDDENARITPTIAANEQRPMIDEDRGLPLAIKMLGAVVLTIAVGVFFVAAAVLPFVHHR